MPQSQLSPALLALIRAKMSQPTGTEQSVFLKNLTSTGGQGTQENPYNFPTINVTAQRPGGPGMQNAQVRPGGAPNLQTDAPRIQEEQAQATAGEESGNSLKALIPLLGVGLITAALSQLHGKRKKKAPRTSFAGSLAGGTGYEELAQESPTFLEALAPAIGTGLTTYAQGAIAESEKKKATAEKSVEGGREALVQLVGKGVLPPEELGKRWESGSLEGLESPKEGAPGLRPQDLASMFRYLPKQAQTRVMKQYGLLGIDEVVKDEPQSKIDFANSILQDKARPAYITGDVVKEAEAVAAGGGDWNRLISLYDDATHNEMARLNKKGSGGGSDFFGNLTPATSRLLIIQTGLPIKELYGYPGYDEQHQAGLIAGTQWIRDMQVSKSKASLADKLMYSDDPEAQSLGLQFLREASAGVQRAGNQKVGSQQETGQVAPESNQETGNVYLDWANELLNNWPAGRSPDEVRRQLQTKGLDPNDPYWRFIDQVINLRFTGAEPARKKK